MRTFATLVIITLLMPAVAAAQTAPDDATVVAALEKALAMPISWQVLGGALGALALWFVRHRKRLAAIDTKKEALALLGAVGTPSVAALVAGAPWQVVLVGAVASFMAFVRLNSGNQLPPGHRDEPLKKTGAAIVIALLLTSCTSKVTQAQALAADAMAQHTNEAAEKIAARWASEGDAILDTAESYQQAKAKLEEHEHRYRRIWSGLDVVAALHDVWATGLEEGEVSARVFAAAHGAYCETRQLLGGDVLPQLPALPCPEGAR